MKEEWPITTTFFRKAISILIFAFLQTSLSYSQNLNGIEVQFEVDSIAVIKGSTFTNFLVIDNTTSSEITIQDLAPQINYPGILFYPKSNFTLSAGTQKRLPFKFIANLDFMKMQTNKITFSLSYKSSASSKKIEKAFTIIKEEDKTIAIYPFSRENYINPAQPQSEILIFVENRGYSKRSLKLDFISLPDGLEVTPNQQTISLEGLEKQMIALNVSTRKQQELFPEYYIQVKTKDLADNTEASNSRIKLVVLSSNRQIARGTSAVSNSNYAEFIHNNNNTGSNYQQLRGNIEFSPTENLDGRFNLNTDYYSQNGLYNFYDTWLELQHNKSVLRLGNIQGSDYDYSASGRGGKIATNIGTNSEIELIVLENIYNLYGTYLPQIEGSKMAGAKYSFGDTSAFTGKASYIFEDNPRLSINTQVANFTGATIINETHNISLEAGLSHEKGQLQKDENLGFSVEMNYNATLGNWNFQSLNSFASKSYAGLSRGSFFLNQKIDYQFTSSQRGFLLYQSSQVQPEYLSFQNTQDPTGASNNYPYYFYSTQLVKAGFQFSFDNWNFLISPEVEEQKNESISIVSELLAYRLQTNIGTTFGNHGLNFTSEYSYSKVANVSERITSLKTTLSYKFKGFSLNGTVQLNPSSVNDLISTSGNNQDFVNYNLYTSYNFRALHQMLSGSISAGLNYSEQYQNLNSNIVGALEYKISNNWSTTGYFNYSNFESTQDFGFSGYNYQYSLGLKKYFTMATTAGNHKVRFQLFEDRNYNGILDTDERVLANEIVKLDKFVALTDKNGKVIFQNVPEGKYKLHVNQSAGSRLMVDPIIVVDRNIKMNVGLVKNIRISGTLVEVKQAYDVLNTDVTGILVYAKDEEGKVQTAVVNQNNEFEFYLKDGTYEIYIENDLYSYSNSKQTIVVENSGIPKIMLFEYKKKDTTIKVKKF